MGNQNDSSSKKIRLDKWLWAVRFYKTRPLAQEMIQGGKVHYNNQRCKPSRPVEIGATITLRQGLDEKEIIVQQLVEKRVGAPIAVTCYQETEQSLKRRTEQGEMRKAMNAGVTFRDERPNKKQRRQIIRFKQQD